MSGRLIVHTEASTGRGGQELRTITELGYMRERGYQVVLAAPRGSYIYQRCSQMGIECWPIGFRPSSLVYDILRLGHLFYHRGVYAVGTHSSRDSWAAGLAARLAGVPVLLRYRHVSVPVKGNVLNKWLYRGLCDQIITTGDCISQILHDSLGVPLSHMHTIATGIAAPADMPEREAARSHLCRELGLPADSRFIATVAVLRTWKGHIDLMRAFDSLAAQYPQHHLVCVGEGPSGEHYRSIATGLAVGGRIHFVGHQSDVYAYLRASDVAVLASTKNEGIPQSLLQAMFARTPVVGTQVGGIPEIVLPDGSTGLLAQPNNPQSLARAIHQTLADPVAAQTRVQAAYDRVQAHHTVAAMGARIEAVIADVAARRLAPKQ